MKKAGQVGLRSFSLKEATHQQERMLQKKKMMESASTGEASITLLGNVKKKKHRIIHKATN